jgi:hypothetical protein
MIASCEECSEDAEIPFDNILDRLTGSDPSVTDYVLEVAARCLQCGAEITEKCMHHKQRERDIRTGRQDYESAEGCSKNEKRAPSFLRPGAQRVS